MGDKATEVPITAAAQKKNPSDFLKQALGKAVVVKLNTGVDYRGVLACLDGFMNIAMEQTEEYVDGQLKARYGDCFIRGNNGWPTVVTLSLSLSLSLSPPFSLSFSLVYMCMIFYRSHH